MRNTSCTCAVTRPQLNDDTLASLTSHHLKVSDYYAVHLENMMVIRETIWRVFLGIQWRSTGEVYEGSEYRNLRPDLGPEFIPRQRHIRLHVDASCFWIHLLHPTSIRCPWHLFGYDTIRYEMVYLRALRSGRTGQLNLANGTEEKLRKKQNTGS